MAGQYFFVFIFYVIIGYAESFKNESFLVVTANEGSINVRLSCPVETSKVGSTLWIIPQEYLTVGSTAVGYNYFKYQHLVTTGQLLIREVTSNSSVRYICIAEQGHNRKAMGIVDLKIIQTGKDEFSQNADDNMRRAVVAGGLAGGTLTVLCLVCTFRHKGKKKSTDLTVVNAKSSVSTTTPQVVITTHDDNENDGQIDHTEKHAKTEDLDAENKANASNKSTTTNCTGEKSTIVYIGSS